MAQEQVPAIPGEDPQRLAQPFQLELKELIECGVELRSMQPSLLRANLALEYSQRAKRYLDEVDSSPLREHARRLHEAHRFATALLNRVSKPAQQVLRLCMDVRSDCEIERRRRLEVARQALEAEAARVAAEQRKAEIEHLQEIGRTDEAEARAEEPVVARAVNLDPDQGKPEGEIMVEVWVPKRNDSGEIVFSDLSAYLKWLAETPAMQYLIAHRYAKLKKLLSDNRGTVQPPGLEIEHKLESRTKREAFEDDDD